MKRTLKGMMIKAGIAFCIIPFLILWGSFAVSSARTLKTNIEHEQATVVRLLNLSMENYFYEIEEAMSGVTSDNGVQNILKSVDRSRYDSQLYNSWYYIRNVIGKTCQDFSGVENIAVADLNGGWYCTGVMTEDLEVYIRGLDNDEAFYRHKGRTWIDSFSSGDTRMLVVVKPIIDLNSIEFIGAMYFVIRESEVEKLLTEELNDEKMVLLMNGQQECLYSENEEYRENPGFVITESYVNSYGTSVITGVSLFQYWSPLLKEQSLVLLIFSAVVISVFVLIQYVYRKINGEIVKLLRPGKEKKPEDTSYYEIRQINDEMMSLIQKNDEGERKIVRLVNHCDTITLDKLQAQINPHFLYNTLTSIKYIALENGQKQISELITALIRLLRSTINREGSCVHLKNEVDSVKNYMKIQNIIYKGRIDMEFDVPRELEHLLVPNFILQPLVENSLFHGIHPEEQGGRISIRATLEGEDLYITVQDNGDGFPEDCLLNMMGAENNREMMTNFGLKGVQQKIHILCGEKYGLSVRSVKNVGSAVEIRLPADLKEGDQNDAEDLDRG